MKNLLIFLTVFTLVSGQVIAQDNNDGWSPFMFLIGTWKGSNSGAPGQGEGGFTFSFDLNNNILVRKSHTVYPGHENQPARIHDDLFIIYKENSDNPDKADYFDNEGNALHYVITSSENSTLVFTTSSSPGKPVFRLTYMKMDNMSMDVKFESAMPDSPDDFKVYVEGQVYKTD